MAEIMEKNSVDKIYFYGSLPAVGCIPFGGGEIGNLRTIRVLEAAGARVVPIRKFKSGAKEGHLTKLVLYPFRMISGLSRFKAGIAGSTSGDAIHISGFAGKTIINEFLVVKAAARKRSTLVYELRGGGINEFYEQGSKAYRRMFRWIISKADVVLSQGQENKPLIDSIAPGKFVYYPNFLSDDFLPESLPEKKDRQINLIYIGRLEKEKNVLMTIEAAGTIQRLIPETTLTIVGKGTRNEMDRTASALAGNLTAGSYSFIPGVRHEDLPDLLRDKHFFLFPSSQPREGQSNALTEAMGYGIVPIVSRQGFNRSTVGRDEMVLGTLSAKALADKVLQILDQGMFNELSEYSFNRVKDCYTEANAARILKEVYGF